MEITSNEEIALLFEKQKSFFDAQQTKSYNFRIQQLKQLNRLIKENESLIYEVLYLDLKKNKDEAFFTEISILKSEISYHLKNLKKWMRLQSVSTPITFWPSKSYIQNEPLGVSLIISPWNYPFQLALAPLIGSISSGSCK
jgi:aldehyde dehydrogenase (NAD+)